MAGINSATFSTKLANAASATNDLSRRTNSHFITFPLVCRPQNGAQDAQAVWELRPVQREDAVKEKRLLRKKAASRRRARSTTTKVREDSTGLTYCGHAARQ